MPGELEQLLNTRFVKQQENLENKIEAVRQQLQARVEEYAGSAEVKLKKACFETAQKVGDGFAAEKSDIERTESALRAMQTEKSQAWKEKERLKGEIVPAQKKADDETCKWMAECNQVMKKQRELGVRPEARKVPVIGYEGRGGLFGWVLGKKEVTTMKEDDVPGKEWDDKSKELGELFEKADRLGDEARRLQEQAKEIKRQYADAEVLYEKLEHRLQEKQQTLEEQQHNLEIKIQTSALNYLNLSKNKLRKQVEEYLADDGEPAQQMKEILDGRIGRMEQDYTEQAIQAMRTEADNRLRQIHAAKAGHRSELQTELEQLTAGLERLQNMKEQMEEKLA